MEQPTAPAEDENGQKQASIQWQLTAVPWTNAIDINAMTWNKRISHEHDRKGSRRGRQGRSPEFSRNPAATETNRSVA